MNKVRWGMIGTGMIAKSFAKDFTHVIGGSLDAVVGRDHQKAQVFAQEFGIPQALKTTTDLIQSDAVDAVYIATPHPSHSELAIECLENGKHVLIEKPITMNAEQAALVFSKAKAKNLFACEAMWTRFLPFKKKLKEVLTEDSLGKLETIQSSMGYPFLNQKPERLFNKELGGGSLLDMGVYSIAFSKMLVDYTSPTVESNLVMGPSGVDKKATWIVTNSEGQQCIGASSIDSKLAHDAVISCSRGQVRVPEFWRAQGFYVNDEYHSCDYEGVGLHFQVSAANKAILNGELEAKDMTWQDSLETMRLVDEIFRQSQK